MTRKWALGAYSEMRHPTILYVFLTYTRNLIWAQVSASSFSNAKETIDGREEVRWLWLKQWRSPNLGFGTD